MRRTISTGNLFPPSSAARSGSMISSSAPVSGGMSSSAMSGGMSSSSAAMSGGISSSAMSGGMNLSSAAMSGGMSSSSAAKSCGSTSRESQAPGESKNNNNDARMGVAKLIAEKAIVVVATHECSMCLVVKVLLRELGVNPTLYEVNEADKAMVLDELSRINEGGEGSEGGGGPKKLPAVYVGGKLLGGVKEVMNTHVRDELVPMLKEAGALWL